MTKRHKVQGAARFGASIPGQSPRLKAGASPPLPAPSKSDLLSAFLGSTPAKPSNPLELLGKLMRDSAPSLNAVSPNDPSGISTLHADPDWVKLKELTGASLPNWDDVLAYTRAFANAFPVAMALSSKHKGALQRRELVNALLSLMPPSMREDAAFGPGGFKLPPLRLFHAFPPDIAARFPSFELREGDLPKPGEAFDGMARPSAELTSQVFFTGQQGLFFAPDNRLVRIDHIEGEGENATAVCSAIQIHARGMNEHGFPELPEHTVQQHESGLRIPVRELQKRVFGQSAENRGALTLSTPQDRLLALVWGQLSKDRSLALRGQSRSLFDWIAAADRSFSVDELRHIQAGAQAVASDAVALYTAHPRRVHFKIDESEPWGKEALALLVDTKICTRNGERYTAQREGSAADSIVELSWTSRLLGHPDSFIAGTANCYASGEWRAKMLNGLLKPLGIWPDATSVSRSTHGAFFERIATPDFASGTLQVTGPLNTKMNERIFGLEAEVGLGRGDAHGGRFALRGPLA